MSSKQADNPLVNNLRESGVIVKGGDLLTLTVSRSSIEHIVLIRKAKYDLEKQIEALIQNFERRTGLPVMSVDAQAASIAGYRSAWQVEVKLV